MLEEEIKKNIKEVKDFPHPGISYKDISPILANAQLSKKIIKAFAEKVSTQVDLICGIESRGFLFGMALANYLDLPFVMVRKQGELPGKTLSQNYKLEYGTATIELLKNAIKKDAHVLIHDDVLATGGTAKALGLLLNKIGVRFIAFNFLIELRFLKGKELLLPFSQDIVSLAKY